MCMNSLRAHYLRVEDVGMMCDLASTYNSDEVKSYVEEENLKGLPHTRLSFAVGGLMPDQSPLDDDIMKPIKK